MSTCNCYNRVNETLAAHNTRIKIAYLIDDTRDGMQDGRFPNGLVDAIAYANAMEEAAGALYGQVFGHEPDGGDTGTEILDKVLRQMQDSPKGGSEVHADGWRVIPHTSPWREGERWEVYGPNGGGSVNAGDIQDQTVRDLLDALAGVQASDAEVRS